MAVFDKRNRWLVSTILIIAVVAFAGSLFVPVIPGISSVFRGDDDSAATDPNGTAATQAQQSELETQAKGYELVLEREPDNQTALRGLIDTRIQLNDIQGIVAPLKKLVELNPGQPEYAVLLAQAQQQTGDLEGAAQTYRSALTERPGDMNALRGLTSLLVNQGRPQAAVGLLQDTLQTADQANQVQAGSVDVTSVKLLLGEVYAQQGRYNEAIVLYDEAIESNAQDFRPVLSKAIVLQQQGKTEEAKSLFTTASALAPAEFKDQINQMAAGNSVLTPGAPATEEPAAPEEAAPGTEAAPESEESTTDSAE